MTGFDTPAHRQYLDRIRQVNADGRFRPDWESLQGFQQPQWHRNGKFGVFIHWGVYSVPAFESEWYPRNMYLPGSEAFEHHVRAFGRQSEFGYHDFIPQFTAEAFDPVTWARLFKESGAQFVVPVAEHHDGFAMYETQFSRWKATEMGPHRDVVDELSRAVRDQGMVFGLSSHRAEHWFFFEGGLRFDSGILDVDTLDFYGPVQRQEIQPTADFLEDWLVRSCELVDLYQPQLVFFDWWIEQPAFEPYLREFASYYYNRGLEWGREVGINYKLDAFAPGSGILDIERGQLAGIREEFWQTDTAVAKNSWSYTENNEWKLYEDILGDLVDIVSKNGALLLNIGPRADGSIPEEDASILRGIGGWLSKNGEAIYGTSPWTVYGEGPTKVIEGPFADTARTSFTTEDVRFTTARDRLYATVLAPSVSGEVAIRSLGSDSAVATREIADVTLLGTTEKPLWERRAGALVVTLPEGAHVLPALRVTFAPETRVERRSLEWVE